MSVEEAIQQGEQCTEKDLRAEVRLVLEISPKLARSTFIVFIPAIIGAGVVDYADRVNRPELALVGIGIFAVGLLSSVGFEILRKRRGENQS